MVVIIPKKRQCKKCFSVGYISLLLGAALLLCYLTGVRMTAWNDFIGLGAQGLEGGKASLFPRSLSPLYNYQKTLWGGGGVGGGAKEVVGSEVKGDGAGAGVVPGAKVKRGAAVDSGGDHAGVVNAKGNFDINDLSDPTKMDTIIKSHLSICSRPQAQLEHVLQNSTHPYHGMISTSLKAMRTYVPQQYHPKFTNPCWFASMPGLPPALHKNFTEYRGCMPNAMRTYTEQRAYEIVRLSVTTPANGAKRIMDSLNLSHTADMIPPQCRALADQVANPPSENPRRRRPKRSFTSVNASKLFRECTQRYKLYCMPQVLLAGFPKCATSSMYFMMIKHPELAAARMKEQHLWRDSFIDTDIKLPHKQIQMLYYIYHFERASNEILKNPGHLTIDGSTTSIVPGLYIPYNQVEDMCILPRMVTKLIPNAKMIIMMRNPVDRLYSDYWYLCAKFSWKSGRVVNIPTSQAKNATRIFHQMSSEMIRKFHRCLETESVFECVRQAGVGYAPEVACKGPRIGLSLYYFHIVRWLNILPRDHILFLRTEDFLTDPYTAMKQVYNFLGVSPPRTGHSMTTLTNRNVNEWIKSSEYRKDFTMPKQTREMLNRFFEPYNKMLSRLLKDDRYTWSDIQY